MPILAILSTAGGRRNSHFIHKVTKVGSQSTKGGWYPGCKVMVFASELG